MAQDQADIVGRWITLRQWTEPDYAWAWDHSRDMSLSLLWNGNAESLAEYQAQIASLLNGSLVRAVVDNTTRANVGLIHVYNVNAVERWGFFAAYSSPEFRRRPHVGEASVLMLDLLFRGAGFRKVFAETYEFNDSAISGLERMGAELEGRLREHTTWQGRYWDLLQYGLNEQRWAQARTRFERLLPKAGQRLAMEV